MALIRRLQELDIEGIVALRREALINEPEAFSASPGSDHGQDIEFLRRTLNEPTTQAIFGAFDPDLLAMVGVYREKGEKLAHKAGVWGMYVRREHRGRGFGAALLDMAVQFARSMPGVTHLHLGVSESALAARSLYERAGFHAWGTAPADLQVNGHLVDVHYMVLLLGESQGEAAPRAKEAAGP